MELFWPVWESILGFLGIVVLVWILRWLGLRMNRRLQNSAKNWPYAHGTVEHAEPKMVGEGHSGYWVGELAYSYSVDGEYYSGVFQLPASSESTASDVVQGWKNRALVIHYSRADPSKSVLVLEEQNQPAKVGSDGASFS